MNYSMDKIYMVRSYYENYDNSWFKIVGLFNNKKEANEIAKKWKYFYLEKNKIFDEPKDWKLSEKDIEYGNETWMESIEYNRRCAKYSEILEFREVEVKEYDLNKDMTFSDDNLKIINEDLKSLMVQWDRDYKLNKIV